VAILDNGLFYSRPTSLAIRSAITATIAELLVHILIIICSECPGLLIQIVCLQCFAMQSVWSRWREQQ